MQKLNTLLWVNTGIILFAVAAFSPAAGSSVSNCGCFTAQPTSTSDVLSKKVIRSGDITAGFAAGQQRVKVIINLVEPAEQKAKTRWSSKKSLALLQDKIKSIQNPVLSDLDSREFKLRYRFENQAGFSAEVTQVALEKLKNDPRVVSIEPVYELKPHLRQGIALMNADTYRPVFNGQGTAIAICDTGIDYRHPMLGNGGFPNSKVIGGYDFGDNDSDPLPNTQAHGTCCAGIAAGDLLETGDYIGGVAYNAKLYALKITAGSSGFAYSDAMVAAWNWCVSHKDDDPNNPIVAISTSFGGERHYSTCDGYNPSMTTAANNAVAAGITVLVSSGNEGFCDSIAWPSCISSVISVGAVYDAAIGNVGFCIDPASCGGQSYTSCDSDWACFNNSAADMVACYSNTASLLTLLAPSHDAYTTDIIGSAGYNTNTSPSGDYYDQFGGTSAACPYAAGAVACLQSAAKAIQGNFLSPAQVKNLLQNSGVLVTDGKINITKPRINLAAAIENLEPKPPVSCDVNVVMLLNTAFTITLQAYDDGQPDPPGDLNYIIESLPSHGDLNDPNRGIITSVPYIIAGNGCQVIYTPAPDYIGSDFFTFKTNDGGTPPEGGDSNTATVSINVTPPWLTLLFENFETGLGSFTINNSFGDGSGLWHRTTACDSSLPEHSTPYSLYYGRDISCNYNAGTTEGIVTSPDINLAGVSSACLEFKYMLETEQTAGLDIASVEISVNGNPFTEYLSNTTGTLLDPSGGWISKSLDLSSLTGSSIQFRFRFRTVNNLSNRFPGFYFDDVNVTAISSLPQFTISGNITSASGALDGVIMAGLPGNPVTDIDGNYIASVPYGWSGTVTPIKVGYTFDPVSYTYTDVNRDYNNMNHTASLIKLKISGFIKNDCNLPVSGVIVEADNGGSQTISDANGFYEVLVDYGWWGTVTLSKLNYTFEPYPISYDNVTIDLPDQNYVAVNIYDLDCDDFIDWGDIAVLAAHWLQTESNIAGDFNNDYYVDFIDFALLSLVW